MKKLIISIISALLVCAVSFAQTPAELLRGQESGVRVSATDGSPASVVNTNIRGLNSIWGSSEPLWVVDGAILNASYDEVPQAFTEYGDNGYSSPVSWMLSWNPEDIESIEVLKNTSASALYGIRGANGVVLIKTKKSDGKKLSVNWKSNFGVNFPSVTGEAFKPAFTHNHSVSASSANAGTEYRISAFYRDNKGVVAHTGSQAAGLNAVFDTHSHKIIHFGLNTFLTYNKAMATTGAVRFGSPSHLLAARSIAPLETGVVNSLQGWVDDHDDNTSIFNTTDIFHIDFNFLKTLAWRNYFTVNFQTGTRELWYGAQTELGKITPVNDNGSAAGMVFSSLFTGSFKSELNWFTHFAAKHGVDLTAAFEYIYEHNIFNIISGRNMLSPGLRASGLDMMSTYTSPRKYGSELGQLGLYAKASYDFDKIVGFNLLARFDNVKRYDDKAFEMSPSADLFFDIAKLCFPNANAVSGLRLEGGYGIAGARKFVPYPLFGSLYSGSFTQYPTDVEGFYEGYNRLKTKEAHGGLNIAFLKDRLGLKLAYYDRSTEDNIYLYSYGEPASATGIYQATARKENLHRVSKVSNNGFELDLKASIIRSELVDWTVNANFSYNINKVASIQTGDESGLKLSSYGMTATRNEVGHSVSSLYGYIMDSNNKAVGQGFLGDALPKYFGALNTNLRYWRFNLDAMFEGVGGNKILNLNRMLASGEDFPCSTFVEKGDYFRLSRLKLGYSFDLNKAKALKSLELSISGTNLFTLTGYTGWNPDVNVYGTNNLSQGLDYGSYPLMRALILGLNLKF